MNLTARLTIATRPHITLRDLVKPNLKPAEKAVINRALKQSYKDQERIKKKARSAS